MSPASPSRPARPKVTALRDRLAGRLGEEVRAERRRRGWSLRELGARAGLAIGTVHGAEAGEVASLETYARLAVALSLDPEFTLSSAHRRRAGGRDEDPVHAAMGEVEARRFRPLGYDVALDEPYQHYQFSGRADVVAWSREQRALLHLENRTAFPNVQEAVGSFNGKRAYLGGRLAERLAIPGGWRSETHVLVGLWSGEVLHAVRLRMETFRATCPDPLDAFAGWWRGEEPPGGRRTAFVLLDPSEGGRSDRRRFVGLEEAARVRPRHAGYAEALAALRAAGLA